MVKSRAEIQKAYRERQKKKGPDFLAKERLRTKDYYIPAAQMNKRKLAVRNERARLRNRKSREHKRLRNVGQQEEVVSETSGYGTGNAMIDTDDQDTEPGPSNLKLVVKLPNINKGKGLKKSRARALARARKSMQSLKTEITVLRKKMKTKDTQLLRLKKRMASLDKTSSNVTPKKATQVDLDLLRLTPKRTSLIRKKLLLGNVLMAEVTEAKQACPKKSRRLLHNVIAGKIAKKYRCVSAVSKGCRFSRRSLNKCSSKSLKLPRETRKCLSKDIEDRVKMFLQREDNCRQQPGKSDAKKSDTGEKKQTVVLTDYMGNLHMKFEAENPEIRVSRATFCRLRPRHVLLAAFISRNACLCLRHQNMAHKVQALRKIGVKLSENPETLLLHEGNLGELLKDAPEHVTFKIWKRVPLENGVQKMKLVDVAMDKQQFSTMFQQNVHDFSQHVSRVRKQYRELRNLKENLPPHEMILQMDFAENFSCRSMDEVQTAYWNQTAVTLHPVVAYFRQSEKLCHRSYVIISDDTNHAAGTVLAFLDSLMPYLKKIDSDLNVVHYWTDSPSSQYRNRYIFDTVARHMTLYDVQARWNFFEAGHGKGPCDGLGGTTKRMADEAIRQGNAIIQDATDFYKWAKTSSMKEVDFLYVEKSIIDQKKTDLSQKTIKPIKNTMKFHAVWGCADSSKLLTQETSCYCKDCISGEFCSAWDIVATSYTHQSTEATLVPNVVATGNSEQPITETDNTPPRAITSEVNANKFDGVESGSFVAAVYEGAWYVGQIEEVDTDDDDCEVNFMKKTKNMFKWPERPDKVWIKRDFILCTIKPLIPSGKTCRAFKLADGDKDKIADRFAMFSRPR